MFSSFVEHTNMMKYFYFFGSEISHFEVELLPYWLCICICICICIGLLPYWLCICICICCCLYYWLVQHPSCPAQRATCVAVEKNYINFVFVFVMLQHPSCPTNVRGCKEVIRLIKPSPYRRSNARPAWTLFIEQFSSRMAV